MRLIEWRPDDFELDHAEMDDTHRAFVDLVNDLAAADATRFADLFVELVAHTRAHFGRENELMEISRFPARSEHLGEHERILGEMVQFGERVKRGLVPLGRAYVKERLPEWFRFHAATMDSALAAHLNSRGYNGDQPERRGVASS